MRAHVRVVPSSLAIFSRTRRQQTAASWTGRIRLHLLLLILIMACSSQFTIKSKTLDVATTIEIFAVLISASQLFEEFAQLLIASTIDPTALR
jgi:hypothetical protein